MKTIKVKISDKLHEILKPFIKKDGIDIAMVLTQEKILQRKGKYEPEN